ncbi:MAG: lasso peptide biosynthesis B2 protein [Acidobacteria bacterium]|nr:lasso peptide biosynthesis B2 protein [Acidobacteriota bacterium]
MLMLVFKALFRLVQFDLYLMRGNFSALHWKVYTYPVRKRKAPPRLVEQICSAVDQACIWYPKQALCLQRSAAATCLLRRMGVPAQMVIGVQKLPFRAHAWVEVEGNVVNDKAYTPEMYAVLDRC